MASVFDQVESAVLPDGTSVQELMKVIQIAGNEALRIYSSPFAVNYKSDHSPVTDADLRVNEILQEGLRHLSVSPVVSEESENPQTSSDLVWYIDPIDGTKDFVSHNHEWSISVGCAWKGLAHFGIVMAPALNLLFVGGEGMPGVLRSQTGDQNLCVRNVTSIESSTLIHSRNHYSKEIDEFISLTGITNRFPHGSVALKLALVASGRADVYVNLGGRSNVWDCCAGDAIIRAAGGNVLTELGKTLFYRNSTKISERYYAASLKWLDLWMKKKPT